MKIYSMTATFGKLEHETLTLEPGLNIIEAPNEWGKSTWCTFLVTMLYGLDTRAKTTKAALADKERFAPWSGSPMSGRIDLNWNGRNITIERRSKGRTPMGEFRAYETETGIEVLELTAANCGQQLLGVERSVFTRAGFLRFFDLPVTNDDALRHRLNALVTTGDESGAAEALGQKLRDLKNRCHYNRSGLLPQAEAQRQQLENKLQEHQFLTDQSDKLRKRQQELEQWASDLENHKTALRYLDARDDERRVAEAAAAEVDARTHYQTLEADCAAQPSQQEAEQAIQQINALRQEWDSLQMEEQMLPPIPPAPIPPEIFRGKRPEEAVAQAEADRDTMKELQEPARNVGKLLLIISALFFAAGTVLLFLKQFPFGAPLLGIAAVLVILGIVLNRKHNRQVAAVRTQKLQLCRHYGSNDPGDWVWAARSYQNDWDLYEQQIQECRTLRGDLDSRREVMKDCIQALSGRESLTESLNRWNRVITLWNELADARRRLQQTQRHLQDLQSMAKTAQPPARTDALTYTGPETDRLLSDAADQLRQLHSRLGQCQGQMEALGSSEAMTRELEAVNSRIRSLEQTYAALEYSQKALTEAKMELQRRFAPRITQQAQTLFAQLTDGRYDRLTLAEDLSIHAAAEGEDTLRSHQWRSDGTVDQLYLALRLAVAKELTPEAPLILDDALVRFDDTRLATALSILRREAEEKQVILFTCQGREKHI